MKATSNDKFLYRVAEDLLARFGDRIGEVAVVFNNKRPSLFLRKYLAEIVGRPIWSPSFYTVQEFFTEITGLTAASQLKQFFILLQSYNQLLNQEGEERIGAANFYPVAEVILSDFSQIDYYLVEAASVFRLIGQYAEIRQQFPDFDDEQLAFLETFWKSFSADRQTDMQERFIVLWRRMPGLYEEFHRRLNEQGVHTQAGIYRRAAETEIRIPDTMKHVAFVGFNALSRAEEKLFKIWQDEGKASFYFDADAHYLNDSRQEAGHFIRRNIQVAGLKNALPETTTRINDPEKVIRVIRTTGNTTQGKLLHALTSTAGNAPDRRAIILADESLLLPVIQTVDGENLNITMGYPFRQSLVFGLCNLWLSVQEALLQPGNDGVPYRLVINWLFNPLAGPPEAERQRIYNEIIAKRLTSVSGQWLWPVNKTSAGLFLPVASGTGGVRQLREFLLAAAEAPGMRGLEKRLLAEVLKSLNVLEDNLGQIAAAEQEELRPDFLFRMIGRALEGLSVPFEGEPLSGLQVMGLLESRCLDFEEITIVGMNEGVLPKVSTSPTFIPDNLRRAFGLPVLENQNAIFAYFFYRLLHCAKQVTLIYNGITDDQSSGEPSRFIRQLQFETGCEIQEFTQTMQPVDNQSQKAIVVEKDGPVWNKLQRYFAGSGGAMDEKISASAFTDYLSCPLKFFYGKIAGLKEPQDLPDQIEARLVGSMLHQLMELIYEEAKGKTVTAGYLEQKEALLPELCLRALSMVLQENTGAKVLKPTALQQIVLKVLERYALNILRYDAGLVPFVIRELENKSDYRTRIAVEVGGHQQFVWLYGIIDRIDEHEGRTRIVDYKTGKDKIVFRDLDSLFDENSKHPNKALLQTLFYTWVVEQVKGTGGVEPHLYTVRSFKEKTLFRDGYKVELRDDALQGYKIGFEARMREKLNELFDARIPFRQTTNLETCTYCPYKGVCQR